jgi:hypothetical protein
MFYGRFKNDICLSNTDQDVCMLKDITYLHEMSLHSYRPRFLQLRSTSLGMKDIRELLSGRKTRAFGF